MRQCDTNEVRLSRQFVRADDGGGLKEHDECARSSRVPWAKAHDFVISRPQQFSFIAQSIHDGDCDGGRVFIHRDFSSDSIYLQPV